MNYKHREIDDERMKVGVLAESRPALQAPKWSCAEFSSMATVNNLWPRRIGILGGLGPFAHLEFERRLLEAASCHLGRRLRDQEFPSWILASLPQTPDRSAAMLLGEASPVPLLLEGLRLLGEADFALIVCNTAHIFIQELRDHSDLPILDMVAETIRAVADDRRKRVKVGLLGTTGTLESRLYQETSRTISSHLEFITPLELKVGKLSGEAIQKRYVTDVIFGRSDCPDELGGGIKAGAHNEPRIRRKMRARLTRLVRWLAESGAHTVILGCTELPIVLGSGSLDGVSLIDPLEIVASSAVKIAAGVRPLPR